MSNFGTNKKRFLSTIRFYRHHTMAATRYHRHPSHCIVGTFDMSMVAKPTSSQIAYQVFEQNASKLYIKQNRFKTIFINK